MGAAFFVAFWKADNHNLTKPDLSHGAYGIADSAPRPAPWPGFISVPRSVLDELDGHMPKSPPAVLSRAEKDRAIQRGFHGLYRWYVDRSQARRNWNPDRSFDWRALGQHHSPELLIIVEGFYGVEQYAPDFTSELIHLVRKGYGRSQFQLRWGAEEEKHADLWRNVLLFSGARTGHWIEQYTEELREDAWKAPYDDPLRMLLYTVIQERATQLYYLNILKIARGQSDKPQFAADADPILAHAALTIAVDEAAHYGFFLEGARLFLYYYPEETLTALVDVLDTFAMPALDLLPNSEHLGRTIYEGGVFDGRIYSRDVVKSALKNMGVTSLRAVEKGVARTRQVPNRAGLMSPGGVVDGVDFALVEGVVEALFARIGRYEDEIGLSALDPTLFSRHSWTAGEIRRVAIE
jgi:acyl-[acyl-carrier-protein] desaturase